MKMSWKRLLLYRDDLNHIFIFFVLLGWLNFILKGWPTIGKGAEPSAQNLNSKKDTKQMMKMG